MTDILRKILNEGFVETESGKKLKLNSSIHVEEGKFIQNIIKKEKPLISIEVGCAYGISSLFICEALESVGASKHIIIDPFQNDDWNGIGLLNLKRAGYDGWVDFFAERSYNCLPRLLSEGLKVDFAFIDGMHTFDYVLVDFFYIDKILNVGGTVVFDDYAWPPIKKVCRYILTNLAYECVGPTINSAVSTKKQISEAVAGLYPFSRISAERYKLPERKLGLPTKGDYVALRKLADDRIGKSPECTRSWGDDHKPF